MRLPVLCYSSRWLHQPRQLGRGAEFIPARGHPLLTQKECGAGNGWSAWDVQPSHGSFFSVFRILVAATVVALLLGAVPAAWAQGCVMCKTSAAAIGEESAKTLDLGIFILLIPAVTIFLGIFFWMIRYRNQVSYEEERETTPADVVASPAAR